MISPKHVSRLTGSSDLKFRVLTTTDVLLGAFYNIKHSLISIKSNKSVASEIIIQILIEMFLFEENIFFNGFLFSL